MKRYKCEECGAIFDEDEIARWEEYRGEFWGTPAYETEVGCPHCHSCDIEIYDPDGANEADDEEIDGDDDDGCETDQ